MKGIDESTDTTEHDPRTTSEMISSEPLPASREIPHDKPPQRSAAEFMQEQREDHSLRETPRRKIRKPLFIVLTLFIIVGIVGAGWYVFFYMKTPAYAFKQIKKAYDTHDIELFNQYVDADAFCQQTVDDYMTWVDQNDLAGTATDVWSELGKTIAESMIQSMKPQMVAEMKKNLSNSVEDAAATFASSTFSLKNDIVSIANPQSFINETPLSAVTTGKVTTLKFTVFDSKYNQNLEIDLLLRDTGRHLQVVRMGNFADWLDRINKFEQAQVDLRNQQETTNMETSMDISNFRWNWVWQNEWTIYEDLTFSGNFKNTGSGKKTIDNYIVTLTVNDSSNKKIVSIDFDENTIIKPNSTVTSKVVKTFNLYDTNDKKLLALLQGKSALSYDVKYTYLHFTNGTEFRLHKKFE